MTSSPTFEWPLANRSSFSSFFSSLEGAITIPALPAPTDLRKEGRASEKALV